MNELKQKFQAAAKATLVSVVVVPLMGVVAHFTPNKGKFMLDDASLSDRFHVGYNINPDQNRTTYVSHETRESTQPDGYDDTVGNPDMWVERHGKMETVYHEEKYAGTPLVIYPLHLLVAGLAYARLRRRDRKNNTHLLPMHQKQR